MSKGKTQMVRAALAEGIEQLFTGMAQMARRVVIKDSGLGRTPLGTEVMVSTEIEIEADPQIAAQIEAAQAELDAEIERARLLTSSS